MFRSLCVGGVFLASAALGASTPEDAEQQDKVSRRRTRIAALRKIVDLSTDPTEQANVLLRLGELYWEESRFLASEAKLQNDAQLLAKAQLQRRQGPRGSPRPQPAARRRSRPRRVEQRRSAPPCLNRAPVRPALLRALTLPLTLLWLGYGLGILWSEGSRGFPDSHLTAYDRAVTFPNTVLGCVGLGAALCITLLGTFAHRHLTRAKLWFFVALFAVLLALYLLALPWYFQVHLGLEHGQGG